MVCGGPDKNFPLIYRMTFVNMGKQNKQGYTGYTETQDQDTQDIKRYTGYTVLLG